MIITDTSPTKKKHVREAPNFQQPLGLSRAGLFWVAFASKEADAEPGNLSALHFHSFPCQVEVPQLP